MKAKKLFDSGEFETVTIEGCPVIFCWHQNYRLSRRESSGRVYAPVLAISWKIENSRYGQWWICNPDVKIGDDGFYNLKKLMREYARAEIIKLKTNILAQRMREVA